MSGGERAPCASYTRNTHTPRPCCRLLQVQALRAIEPYLGLEKLYVSHCLRGW